MRYLKLFENFSDQEREDLLAAGSFGIVGVSNYKIYVTSCEPTADGGNPGNWKIYPLEIIVRDILDYEEVEETLLQHLIEGKFVLADSGFCDEIDEVFNEEKIQSLAGEFNDLEEFIETLQDIVYDACYDWYMNEGYRDTNTEALHDIIYNPSYGGGCGFRKI